MQNTSLRSSLQQFVALDRSAEKSVKFKTTAKPAISKRREFDMCSLSCNWIYFLIVKYFCRLWWLASLADFTANNKCLTGCTFLLFKEAAWLRVFWYWLVTTRCEHVKGVRRNSAFAHTCLWYKQKVRTCVLSLIRAPVHERSSCSSWYSALACVSLAFEPLAHFHQPRSCAVLGRDLYPLKMFMYCWMAKNAFNE